MADFLDQMAKASRARADELDPRELRAACQDLPPAPKLDLQGWDLICEVKRRSPSEGALPATTVPQRVATYALAGAAAISVLTEPSRFDGSLQDLAAAAEVSPVPVMRKDFLVRACQLHEGRLHGAGGALVVAAIVDDLTLMAMLEAAAELGMFVLLEAFDEHDLERIGWALDAGPRAQALVGVNCRDLRTLAVDPERFEKLADHIPDGVTSVAESGLHTAEDAADVRLLGYRVGLVGTALMRADDPDTLIREMLREGRLCA